MYTYISLILMYVLMKTNRLYYHTHRHQGMSSLAGSAPQWASLDLSI
jgi:hypothetical protein